MKVIWMDKFFLLGDLPQQSLEISDFHDPQPFFLSTVNTSKERKGRKGVSPLVSSVILVVITLSIGFVLLGSFTNLQGKLSEDAETGRQLQAECQYRSVKISDVFFNTTTNTSRITITNDGNGNLTLKTAFAIDKEGNRCTFTVSDQVLEKGDLKLYQNTSCSILASDCSDFSHAETTTTCGNAFDTFRVSPTCSS